MVNLTDDTDTLRLWAIEGSDGAYKSTAIPGMVTAIKQSNNVKDARVIYQVYGSCADESTVLQLIDNALTYICAK